MKKIGLNITTFLTFFLFVDLIEKNTILNLIKSFNEGFLNGVNEILPLLPLLFTLLGQILEFRRRLLDYIFSNWPTVLSFFVTTVVFAHIIITSGGADLFLGIPSLIGVLALILAIILAFFLTFQVASDELFNNVFETYPSFLDRCQKLKAKQSERVRRFLTRNNLTGLFSILLLFIFIYKMNK